MMTNADRIDETSPDMQSELLARLRIVIPEAFSDGQLDLERLAELAGDAVATGPERYGLTWPGKREAITMLQAPSRATLVPETQQSVNFDDALHVFIEGENLEVLKLLYKSYFGQVKLIYIDPPYNTGNDFIYHDDFADPLANYLRQTGQMTDDGEMTTSAPEKSGRKHSNWLSMMYPRLSMARQFLRDDGVIAISIDDIEVKNLRMLCDEIFGEENFVAQMVWEGAGKNDARQIGINHEYVLVYARQRELLEKEWAVAKIAVEPVIKESLRLREKYKDDFDSASRDMAEWFKANKSTPSFAHRRYRVIDKIGLYKEENPTAPGGRKFDLINPKTGAVISLTRGRGWGFDQETFNKLVDAGRITFVTPTSIMLRLYLHETDKVTPQSVFYQPARSASERLGRLLDAAVFDFPKDEVVLSQLVEMATGGAAGQRSICMDFFAGSAPFAHAVMAQNITDGKQRRFLAVQYPEPLEGDRPEQADAYNFCISNNLEPTISAISRERIRRSIKLIEKHNPTLGEKHSFRSFRLAISNIRRWAGINDATPEDYIKQMDAFADTLLPGWKAEDVIWEVALREGFPLSATVTPIGEAKPPTFWRVSDDEQGKAFIISLAGAIDLESVKALGLSKTDMFVCRDTALDDTVAANLALQCTLKVL